ncbi:hypothetical protein [Kutzneria chonburiensis]|uniref:Spore-associated protein n=1 Tax=Kutzneria chonburiensis TaxID=1483604 RepID=A0ABV6MRA8_9PSEU|nr:hypothetical protein [Kutzneria chonburiensis]
MRPLVRTLAPAAVAVLAMTGAAVIADTGTASAAGWGCSGSEVSDSPYPVKTPSGAIFSYVHLYWDGSTGRNCAVNVKTGALYGTPSLTEVALRECSGDTPSPHCDQINVAGDNKVYSYYAGPVSVPGAGHCIMVEAWTLDANRDNQALLDLGPFHC